MFAKLLNMKQEDRFDYMLNNVKYDVVMDVRNEGLARFRAINQKPTANSFSENMYLLKLSVLIDDCENFLFH